MSYFYFIAVVWMVVMLYIWVVLTNKPECRPCVVFGIALIVLAMLAVAFPESLGGFVVLNTR